MSVDDDLTAWIAGLDDLFARAAWSCLSGGTTRPRALAGVVAAHDAMRAEAGRTADEEDCDPPAAAAPASRAR